AEVADHDVALAALDDRAGVIREAPAAMLPLVALRRARAAGEIGALEPSEPPCGLQGRRRRAARAGRDAGGLGTGIAQMIGQPARIDATDGDDA
ncbi:hypothetical protein DF186_14900, partial [Enterococcus hirae]